MAGNSARRGAVRRPGSKKGATSGSGGQVRKSLQGRGPTPKATERTGHPAARRAGRSAPTTRSNDNEADQSTAGSQGSRGPQGSGAARPTGRSTARGTGRPREGTETVCGRNPVVEALRAAIPAKALYVATRIESDDRVREALTLAGERGLPLLEATRTDLDRLSGGGVHQGLLLQVPPYQYAHPADLLAVAQRSGHPALLVALDGVTDPHNLGAVVRSVAAFGGHGVIVPERRAAGMTASAWKTSAGTAARTRVARATNLTRTLIELQQAGCFVVGLDAGGTQNLTGLSAAREPLVLVAGAEGKGLSRLVRETCDVVAGIPLASGAESLNAAVAAGVALYEVARLRAG